MSVGRWPGSLPISTKLPPVTDAADCVPVTQVVTVRFAHGITTSVDQVVEETRLHAGAVKVMMAASADAALARIVANADGGTFARRGPRLFVRRNSWKSRSA